MGIAGLALLAAALGEALARIPGDACLALTRGLAPRPLATQLLGAWWRCAAVLAAGTATAVTTVALADPAWSWVAASSAVALGLLPLAAAPVAAAPLLGAPLRVGLLVWCAARVLERLGPTPVTAIALLTGSAAATAVGGMLSARRLVTALGQMLRDSVAVLVASPIVLAVGMVPLLVGLPLAPWELWRYCQRQRPGTAPLSRRAGPGRLFVVYLDGVGKTWRPPTRVARDLARALGAALPGAWVVTDVLPYSPLQLPLTERPGSGRVWRWLRRRAFPMLVGRNILQTLVVCDARYQQAYGQALARAMAGALQRAGYCCGDRVAVLGYSGGALPGVAAADWLADLLGMPPLVISLGGYLDGHRMPHRAIVHHVVSGADHVERLGRAMFPGRWAVARRSAWNRALARGMVVPHQVIGSRHVGRHGYLAAATGATDPPETSNLIRTVAAMTGLLQSGPRH